ncbi:hypothetical protein BGZ89_000986 [Linnemannia elongata]|nr:hypothetical protein BGZ89_000986 [Linnemannia elongata]
MINSTLTTLDLKRNKIGDNGARALFNRYGFAPPLVPTLDSTDFVSCCCTLSEALKTNSTLTTLNLESNNIGNNGAQALSRALKTNSTVTISGLVLPDKSKL